MSMNNQSLRRDRRKDPSLIRSGVSLDIDSALARRTIFARSSSGALDGARTEDYTGLVMSLSPHLYQQLRQNIEDDFAARKRELEEQRRQAILALNEAWPKMGGSEVDITTLAAGEGRFTFGKVRPAGGGRAEAIRSAPRGGDITANGETGRTIPMKVLEAEARDYLAADEIDLVTQTDVKDKVLEKYPDAKVHSVRSAISHYLSELAKSGELELVEKGRAGKPSVYRKTRKSTEANLLGP